LACALALLLGLLLPGLAAAQDAGANDPAAILAEAGAGTRWGLVVADQEGREILALNPDNRFIPASNTKVFTTAAAMWARARGEFPQPGDGGTRVRLARWSDSAVMDVVLEGRGDTRLSAAGDCLTDCLSTLAAAIARQTDTVRDVIGDDTAFPDERWSPGMSWNNIPTRSGTGISALSVDDNEIAATVTPGAIGSAPLVSISNYYGIENHAVTVAGTEARLVSDRAPNERTVVLSGTIGAAAPPEQLRFGIDDPALYAATLFHTMLTAHGVRVTGQARARHRPLLPSDDPRIRGDAPVPFIHHQPAIAVLTPPPLDEVLTPLNKISQNLYAELILRRLGLIRGTGSIADGQAVVRAMLDQAGAAPHGVSLSDGSGMSSYNRVAPRAMVRLLGWIARQPWGAEFRATLPVGGVDGTLAKRFAATPLAGKLFAKTGTLNATNALAGYLTAASGRTLTFAIYANDVPEEVKATQYMDRALVAIAAAN